MDLELYLYVPDREIFIKNLIIYVRECLALDADVTISQYEDMFCLIYKTMNLYIYLSDYEQYCRTIEKLDNVKVNLTITATVYNAKYNAGVIDIGKITNYYFSQYEGDYVLTGTRGETILIRREGKIFFHADPLFPFRYNEEEELYLVYDKAVYKGMEFDLVDINQLKEKEVDIYTEDVEIAEQNGFISKWATYVKRIPISEIEKMIVKQEWLSGERKGEIIIREMDVDSFIKEYLDDVC